MAEPRLQRLPDEELGAVLRGLAPALAWPSAQEAAGGPDLAATVRLRIESMPVPTAATNRAPGFGGWVASWGRGWRPARRALALALLALLAVAAIAGAVGLGLPGLRIIQGDAPPGASPGDVGATPGVAASSGPTVGPVRSSAPSEVLGTGMRLGEPIDPADRAGLDERAGFTIRLPADPAIGAPEAAWVDADVGGQVTLLWAVGGAMPATLEPEVGLLLSQFRGDINEGFLTKMVGGGTVVERVRVDGQQGYWISGEPHVLFWDGPGGLVDDPRRWVGDVLLWSDGPITYRLETSLGRDAAIGIAQGLR